MQEVTPLLEFRRVGKRFGVVHALSEVTLPIHAGEILALVGENGAGKSTLTRIMEGVHQPDAGEVVIDGAPVRLRAPAEAHAAGIRVIHQEPDIFPDLSVAENLFVGDLRRVAGIFLDRADLAVAYARPVDAFWSRTHVVAMDPCRSLERRASAIARDHARA